MTTEHTPAAAAIGAALTRAGALGEDARAGGLYHAACLAPVPHMLREYIDLRDRIAVLERAARKGAPLARREHIALLRRDLERIPLELKWFDGFHNTVVTEGKNAALTHFLKGSAYTASQVLGLIEDAGYSAIGAGNTAANITANASGSPANGWNEAQSSTAASRGTPSFGTASSGSLATSSSVSFSILATDVIKGAFLLCRSTGGTAPSTTVGNTSGALYSAGLFSGGDRSVANGDTLNVTYTASL